MLITCENCQAVYSIIDKVIGENGRMVKCAKCNHTWMVNLKKHEVVQETPSKSVVLQVNNSNIKALKILSSLLCIAICLVSLLAFHDFFSEFPLLKQVYEKIGIYNNDGINLTNFSYKIKDENLLITGEMSNNSGIDKITPDIHYILLDDNRSVIFSAIAKSSGKILRNNEKISVNARIANLSDQAEYLQLDIHNKLELPLHK